MAREETYADGHFVGSRDIGGVQKQIVYGAPVKIHRAASESMGKDVHVEVLDRHSAGDWSLSEQDVAEVANGKPSGFARFAEMYGDTFRDQNRFPIEGTLGTISKAEESRILEAADGKQGLMGVGRRVQRDPVTNIPENIAEIDRMSESNMFFGKDKPEAETTTVLERMKHVDRGREKVDYRTSTAIPIKIMRGK